MTTRLKKLAKNIPANRAAAEAMVRETVAAQIECEKLVALRDAARADADKPFVAGITEHTNTMARNLELLEAYSEQHKTEFGEARSLTIAGHRMGWKLGNWKTSLMGKTRWADVLAELKDWATCMNKVRVVAAGRWLRVKEEPNKEAMIGSRDDSRDTTLLKDLGVEIIQEETFYLSPDREGQDPALLTADAK